MGRVLNRNDLDLERISPMSSKIFALFLFAAVWCSSAQAQVVKATCPPGSAVALIGAKCLASPTGCPPGLTAAQDGVCRSPATCPSGSTAQGERCVVAGGLTCPAGFNHVTSPDDPLGRCVSPGAPSPSCPSGSTMVRVGVRGTVACAKSEKPACPTGATLTTGTTGRPCVAPPLCPSGFTAVGNECQAAMVCPKGKTLGGGGAVKRGVADGVGLRECA
jgi:hypothetical protein